MKTARTVDNSSVMGKRMLLLALLVLFCSGATVALLESKDGSYTNIMVAFDRSLIRSKKQVTNLENLIKHASRELYIATQGLAYFKNAMIILAHQNEYHEYREMIAGRSSIFSRADIRIISPNVEHGVPDAFTLQTGECGEQGEFILLSDNFFKSFDSENATKLAARRLVQEWARYRYGVFDELPSWGEKFFRWEAHEILPATCVDGIQGWVMTENQRQCVLDCGRVRSNCRFFPDPKSNSGMESSLMSFPHLPNVKYFCNNDDHNKKAPSKQNKMCESRSIMEVIWDHEDFKDAHQWLNTSKKESPQETRIFRTFDPKRILEFVFVVESSQMMEENGTQEVQQFIERFFVHLAPERARAGFIKFSNESKILWRNVQVGNKTEWQSDCILNVSDPVGSTNATPDIGMALREAIEEYTTTLFPTIILISTGNGEAEVKQYITTGWDNSWQKIPTIHSINIGSELNWKLDRVSQMNGGNSYFLREKKRGREEHLSFNLDMAFLASMHSTVDDHELPVVIYYEQIPKIITGFGQSAGAPGDHSCRWSSFSFYVDNEIGKDLVVTFSPNVEYGFRDQIGYERYPKTHEYEIGSSMKIIIVDDAEPGIWRLDLCRDEPPMSFMVTAKPRCSRSGSWVWVRAWIANVREDQKGIGNKGYHRIYAEVKMGYSPVINATVIATVEIPGRRDPIKLTLKDNGGVPDVFKDDGIYTNFFPVTERPAGRPIVIASVFNVGNTTGAWVKPAGCKKSRETHGMLDDADYQRATKKFGASKSRFPREDFMTNDVCEERKEEEVRVCALPLPPFQRAAMANSPILFAMSKDEVRRTPPAPIWDLKVVNEFVRRDGFFAVLQWTSPEHPQLDMKVATIEVRGSRHRNLTSLKGFSSLNTIWILDHIEPAGEIQQFELKIQRHRLEDDAEKVRNFYLALRAQDARGNIGELSNIAEAFFEGIDVKEEMGALKGKKKSSKGRSGNRSWVPWTVGLVVVIVAAVVGAVGYLMWKNKNKGGMPNVTEMFQRKESEHSC